MIAEGWYICPICKKKRVQPVQADTTIINAPLYCKNCHQNTIPHIENGEETKPPRFTIK